MKGIGKKIIMSGIAAALLMSPIANNQSIAAKEVAKTAAAPTQKNELTKNQAVQLATTFSAAASYVQRGGDYKPGEYKTFTYKGKTYRFLASNIDTKKELISYLGKSLTQSAAEKWIKDNGIIEHKGKLAQVEADGGSLLQWQKATAELLKENKVSKTYLLTVPVGATNEKQQFLIDYQYVEKTGWRISKEPYLNLDVPGNVNPAYNFFRLVLVDAKATQDLFLSPSSFKVELFKKDILKLEYQDIKEINRTKSSVDYLVRFNAELSANYKGDLTAGENYMYFSIQPVGYMDFKIAKIGIVKMY
jgi:iseA protein